MREARVDPDLPERFSRLYIPEVDRFETPLDDRGIADINAVFELAVRTYPDELPEFGENEKNHHHLYWTEDWWKSFAQSQEEQDDHNTIMEFRNSAPQLMYVPIPIHRWIEVSQIPPPPPSLEVMRQRNNAWSSAALLLKSCVRLDKARNQYSEMRGVPRKVLGNIEGVTHQSQKHDDEYLYVIDDEYWLSQLELQLEGWREVARQRGEPPREHGFIRTVRLSEVRKFRKRVKDGRSFIPELPESIAA